MNQGHFSKVLAFGFFTLLAVPSTAGAWCVGSDSFCSNFGLTAPEEKKIEFQSEEVEKKVNDVEAKIKIETQKKEKKWHSDYAKNFARCIFEELDGHRGPQAREAVYKILKEVKIQEGDSTSIHLDKTQGRLSVKFTTGSMDLFCKKKDSDCDDHFDCQKVHSQIDDTMMAIFQRVTIEWTKGNSQPGSVVTGSINATP